MIPILKFIIKTLASFLVAVITILLMLLAFMLWDYSFVEKTSDTLLNNIWKKRN